MHMEKWAFSRGSQRILRFRTHYLTKPRKLESVKFTLIFLGTLLFTSSVLASDFHSPRTEALGGAGHAGPSLNDAIYLNPSYTSFLQTYSVAFTYLWYNGPDLLPDGSNAIHGRNVNVSLQDGRSEAFQAGVGYTRKDDYNLLTLGASKALLQQLGVGLGGKFLFPSTPGADVVRDSTLSMTFAANGWMQFSAIVDNLLETDAGKSHNLYREYILGSKFNLENILILYFDPHWTPSLPDQSYGYELGAELGLFQDFFLRFGTFKNSAIPQQNGTRGRGYGVGAGWVAPRISLDFAISRNLEPRDEVVHVFGATVFF